MSLPEASLKSRAVQLLARREHSRAELRKKLAPHAESPEQLETLLDDLVRQGFLSDARFVESHVNTRSGRYGSRRIADELRKKGVAEALVSETVARLKEADLQTARQLWVRKFAVLPTNAKEKARQIRFLESRGFSFDIIRHVLSEDQ